ncbi:DNA circularization N-terminal domain-containing protein [Vibrio nigripulchritudo]|uniref:DNA circularization N-terminal domain-containing protein n=1 Tax=Vibrio nigripulchritudo TaxID=28173 RepID=UPI0005FA144F|nr:DNA circularization N-terminal domain-containing protein [Vibrio nigripulchritudo]KJY78950.1 hypothetical protein TW74_09610 [Vibrio nigripulchritudo]
MWARQYEHARWNGHKLNILSTSIEGGQRLQVSEIPYADLPHIKVMGGKAREFTFEVVFVGASSLADANALIENLETTPRGELEHPWLGELPLVFEDVSQNINTRKGLVTLTLKFVRSGNQPAITTETTVHTKARAARVEELSKETFSEKVQTLNVSEINQTQFDVIRALNVLVDITSRLNLPDESLHGINHSINEGYSAVSSISTHPAEFADLFTAAFDTVANGVQSEVSTPSDAVDNSRSSQALVLKLVTEDSPTQHYNIQMVTAAIKMSRDITELERNERFDITRTSKQPDIIRRDLTALATAVENRIADVTQVSTMESMAVFDALLGLKRSIQTQYDKVTAGSLPHRTVQSPRFKSALNIAHDEYTKEGMVTSLNALQHPLFMRGDVALRDAE